MARRRRKETPLELLYSAPWPLSVLLAMVGFIVLKWIIPVLASGNPVLMILGQAAKSLAPWVFWFFVLLGVVSFIRQRSVIPRLNVVRSQPRTENRQIDRAHGGWSPPVSTQEPDNLGIAWGNLEKPPQPPAKPTVWSIELLRAIDWKLFEEVAAALFRERGMYAKTQTNGADGGIDILLGKPGQEQPHALVQCKSWKRDVGVKEVRELLGVMTSHKINAGIFVSASGYTSDARQFAASNPCIQLLTGEMLLADIRMLPEDAQNRLLKKATTGDYLVPSCASCGIKLVWREGKDGSAFWGCRSYPRCKTRIFIKRLPTTNC